MRICYQAIEGFRSKTLRCWREDRPDVVTVTTLAEGYITLTTQVMFIGVPTGPLTPHDTPREAGEWVENWLRTYEGNQ